MPDLIKSKLNNYARLFVRDEGGAIISMTLILLVTMLVIGGMSVDFMRREVDRIYLQGVADRSVLAAASLSQEVDGDDIVIDFFEKAGVADKLVTTPGFTDTGNSRTVTVLAESDVDTFYLWWIGIPDLDTVAAATATEGVGKVEISLVIDVSASMRQGGSNGNITRTSLNTGGRIYDLRNAAKAFAEDVLDPDYDGQVSLNIIPFGGQTNPGKVMFDHVNGQGEGSDYFDIPYNAILPGSSDAIIMLSSDDAEEKAVLTIMDNPNISLLTQDYDPDVALELLSDVNGDPIMLTLPDGTERQMQLGDIKTFLHEEEEEVVGDDGTTTTTTTTSDILLDDNGDPISGRLLLTDEDGVLQVRYRPPHHCIEVNGVGDWTSTGLPASGQDIVSNYMIYNYEDYQAVAAVRNWGWCPKDETTIKYAMQTVEEATAYIDGLTMYDGTGTDIAMKWGLATLDPDAQPAFQELYNENEIVSADFAANRPAPYDDNETTKIIVLMTDGQITSQIRPRDPDDVELLIDPTPANMNSPEDWLGTIARNASGHKTVQTKAVSRTNLEAICTLAKDQGIEVYTVAFEYQSNTGAEDVEDMTTCASDKAGRQYYYEAFGSGLTDVFKEIAEQITDLRLTF